MPDDRLLTRGSATDLKSTEPRPEGVVLPKRLSTLIHARPHKLVQFLTEWVDGCRCS